MSPEDSVHKPHSVHAVCEPSTGLKTGITLIETATPEIPTLVDDQPPRVSMLRAIFAAPFRPAWVAERTTNLSLKRAWLIHFISALTTVAVIVLLVQWAERSSLGPHPFAEVLQEAKREIGLLVSEFYRRPLESTLVALVVISLVEGMHLQIALWFMPWGARDEPLRKSFGFALRQTWISNTRLVMAAILIGGPLAYIQNQDHMWRRSHPGPDQPTIQWPAEPTIANTDPNYARVNADFDAAFDEALALSQSQWNARNEWLAKRPWYLIRPEVFGIPLGIVAALWFLWALLRSIGATRNVSPITRDRRCIECGYNLHTIPMESRCPECGKPVIESLGPDVHPGTAWESHQRGDTLLTWWLCAYEAVFAPKTLGKSLKVSKPGTAHRHFLAINLAGIWLVGVGAVFTAFFLFGNPGDYSHEPELFVLIPVAVGSLCLAGTLAVACGGAILVGLLQSLTQKRNLLPAAMQVASYLSGFLLCWAILGAFMMLTLIWMDQSHMLQPLAKTIGMRSDVFATYLFIIPNAACAASFIGKLTVATAATRYANK